MPSIKKKMDIPEKERALVLQGGGSLGAYEAGAYEIILYVHHMGSTFCGLPLSSKNH